jgi:hypothetical protein
MTRTSDTERERKIGRQGKCSTIGGVTKLIRKWRFVGRNLRKSGGPLEITDHPDDVGGISFIYKWFTMSAVSLIGK